MDAGLGESEEICPLNDPERTRPDGPNWLRASRALSAHQAAVTVRAAPERPWWGWRPPSSTGVRRRVGLRRIGDFESRRRRRRAVRPARLVSART